MMPVAILSDLQESRRWFNYEQVFVLGYLRLRGSSTVIYGLMLTVASLRLANEVLVILVDT